MAVEAPVSACYIDTSALIKRYVPERGSDVFDDYCLQTRSDLLISPLVGTEFVGALQRRLREKHLTARQIAAARQRFAADLSAGAWTLVEFGTDVFSRASDLIAHLGSPLATLDALHLACALQHGATELATGDRQLATAARKAGLAVHAF